MADLNFRFQSTGADSLSRDMGKVADTSELAARGARRCKDALQAQERATRSLGDYTLTLRKAENLLSIAEREVAKEADKAERALHGESRAALEAAAANRAAAAETSKFGDALDGISKKTGPTGLGLAAAFSPALIPVAAGLAGAVAAVGASFGAVTIAGGIFGKMASSVLAGAGKDAGKLSKLQDQLAAAQDARTKATTKAQKAAADQRIAKIKDEIAAIRGQGDAYSHVVDSVGAIKAQWKELSQAVASPVLVPWLDAVNRGMRLLRPLVQPIADLFKAWGEAIDRYFASAKGSAELNRIATALGRFAADQMSAIGVFFTDMVAGVANLGRLLGVHGTDFGAFSVYLDQWGGAFKRWSASDSARKAVTGFLDYVHTNGKTLGDLVKNLATVMGNLTPGLSAAGALELKALTDFFGFVAQLPKGVQETLGALLLLSKTGVVSVGIKFAGTVGPALLKWLTGGVINIGSGATAAAEIQAAMVTGGKLAGAEIATAMTGAGTATGTAVGAAEATAIGSSGLAASLAKGLVAAAGPALVLLMVNQAAAGLGKQAGQKLPGLPKLDPGSTLGKGINLALSNMAQQIPALAPTLNFLKNMFTGSAGAAKQLTDNLGPLRTSLANITTVFASQMKAAQSAQTSLDSYTNAVKINGAGTDTAKAARQQLVTDLTNAGINSGRANSDVSAYTQAVTVNGAGSDAAQAARKRLEGDILSARTNAQKGQTDVGGYTTAIQNHSSTSDAVRSARTRLIGDLKNTGTDAHTSTGYVDGLTGAVKGLPAGKTIDLVMVGNGTYVISERMTSATNPFPGGISGRKAAGGLISMGTGPTADDVHIMASRGEYVQQATAVSKYGVGAMNAVNAGRAVIAYAGGGPVGGYAAGGPVTGNLTAGFIDGMYTDFEHMMTNRFVQRMRASIKQAESAGTGQSVLAYAMQYLGTPYVWGGSTPAGWDCSGFVSWVYDHLKLFSGRTTAAGFQSWAKPTGPVPGGLAFYGRPAHHVGFVTQDGRLLSALGHAFGTLISSLQMGDNSGYGIPPQGFGVPGSGGGAGPGIGASKIKEYAFTLLKQYGWANQWNSFNALEMSEAGWNPLAQNPASTAFGLGQFLDSTWATVGGHKTSDPVLQLQYMMRYIATNRNFHDPNSAWAFHLANNWYGKGGLVRALAAGGAVGAPGSTFVTDTLPDLAGLQAAALAEARAFWTLRGAKLPVKGTKHHPAPTRHERDALAAWDRVLSAQQAKTFGFGGGGLFQRLIDAHKKNPATSPAAFTAALAYMTREVAGTGIRGGINPPGTPRNSGYVPWHYFHPQWTALLGGLRAIATHLKLPAITHTYGGDVADTIAPVLSAALAPFAGGGVSMDRGGWLQPGWNPPMYNGLGRPEPVGAAAGGGRVVVELNVTGADQEFATMLRKMVRVKGGGSVQVAFGAR